MGTLFEASFFGSYPVGLRGFCGFNFYGRSARKASVCKRDAP